MPNQNPLAPMTAPTVQEQLAAYYAANNLTRGEVEAPSGMPVQETSVPNSAFAQTEDPNMQDPENVSQLQNQTVNNAAFAEQSPVNTQQMPQYSDNASKAILSHLSRSGAFKEMFGTDENPGPLQQILDHLRAGYMQGKIDLPTVVEHLREAGPLIYEVATRHHGHEDHKTMIQHPDLYDEPDDVNSILGGA